MKKIPPWAWALAAIGVGVGVYLYKKHKESQRIAEESESSSSSEAPVVAGVEPEEYPYSIAGLGGGGAGSSGAIGNAGETDWMLKEFFGSQNEFEKTFANQEREFQESIARSIKEQNETLNKFGSGSETISAGSSGGAPSGGSPGGTNAPPPVTQTPSCPSSYPHFNGKGSVGSHTCYKDITCGNGCQGHKYQDGHSECQTKTGGKCHW